MAYCEIGTLIPKSGGEYVYFLEAFGPLHKFSGPIMAFLFAWVVVFLLKPSSLAILTLSFSKYLLAPIINSAGLCDDTCHDFCEDTYNYYVLSRLCATVCIGMNLVRK